MLGEAPHKFKDAVTAIKTLRVGVVVCKRLCVSSRPCHRCCSAPPGADPASRDVRPRAPRTSR